MAGKLKFQYRSRRGIALAAVGGGVAVLLALSACTSGAVHNAAAPNTSDSPGASSTSQSAPVTTPPSSSTPPAAAKFSLTPGTHTDLDPTTPISLSVANGTLTKVTMVNPTGTHVTGSLSSDGSTWHTTEVLGYGKVYRISARAVNAAGKATSTRQKISTVTPDSTTTVSMDRMGGYGLDDETYGVAIVPVVHFDTPITDEAAAQKALTVTSSRPVTGVWSWIDNQDVAYRPRSFWPAHTQVTVAAHVYGVKLGPGLYGESDESTHFTIGREQLTVADDNSPKVDKVRVYNAAGHVLRTMDTSMGKHGGETLSNGQYINFYTLDGTYTVLDHENPAIMSSQSYGLPADAPSGYAPLSVPYSTKISTDGIYLHEYNSTQYDQENGYDVSEGCLNLVTDDAVWFYDHSIAGDPVVVHGAKGAPEIQPWEGGYWSIPWSKWKAASAA